jgi:hypothetical protein
MLSITIKILIKILQSTLIPLITKFLEKKLKQIDIDKL